MKPLITPAAGIVVALVMVGCAPPYIAELDRAAGLVRQMTMVGTVGPVEVESGATSVRFLPPRPTASSIGGVNVQSGFMIEDVPGQEILSFVAGFGKNGSRSFPAGTDPHYPLNEYDVTATLGTQAGLAQFTFDPTAAASTYQQFNATIPDGSLTPAAAPQSLANTVLSLHTVIGAFDVPPQPGIQDTFAFLGLSSGTFSGGSSQMNGSPSVIPLGGAAYGLAAALPPTLTRSLYSFSTATGASVASFYFGGRWNCLQWFGAGGSTDITGVTHRIDAVLSTGDLLSTEGGTLRLYDPNGVGTEVLSMDLKGLQFCFEAYVGSSPYVFLVLPATVQKGQRAFSVYAVPSSAMRGLKG